MFFSPPVPSISALEVSRTLKTDPEGLHLLDVRSAQERSFTHIDGLHIPLQELPNRLEELDELRGRKLVVYCRTGHRSASAVAWLRSRGFDRVLNLDGGLHAWHRDVDPTVPLY